MSGWSLTGLGFEAGDRAPGKTTHVSLFADAIRGPGRRFNYGTESFTIS